MSVCSKVLKNGFSKTPPTIPSGWGCLQDQLSGFVYSLGFKGSALEAFKV